MSKYLEVKKKVHIIVFFIIMFFFSLSLSLSGYAEEPTSGSITIQSFIEDGEGNKDVISGTLFGVSKVADVVIEEKDGEIVLNYTLTDEYKASGVEIDLSTASAQKNMAQELYNYADKEALFNNILETEDTGLTTFSDLPLGLYLVADITQTPSDELTSAYTCGSFLVQVPYLQEDGTLLYDVAVEPKYEGYLYEDTTTIPDTEEYETEYETYPDPTETQPEQTDPEDATGAYMDTTAAPATESTSSNSFTEYVNTGDNLRNMILWGLVIVIVVGGMVVILGRRKSDSDSNK